MLPRVLSCTLYAALKQLSPKFKVPVSSSVFAPSFFIYFLFIYFLFVWLVGQQACGYKSLVTLGGIN